MASVAGKILNAQAAPVLLVRPDELHKEAS